MARFLFSLVLFSTILALALGLPAQYDGGAKFQARDSSPGEFGQYFEGDMLTNPRLLASRAGIIGEQYRWPNGVVPYDIHPDFGKS